MSSNGLPVYGKIFLGFSLPDTTQPSGSNQTLDSMRSTSTISRNFPGDRTSQSTSTSITPSLRPQSSTVNLTQLMTRSPQHGAVSSAEAPGVSNPTATRVVHDDTGDRLPEGWEHRIDALGRNYYVDHNTRRTTWNRPDSQQNRPQPRPQSRTQPRTLPAPTSVTSTVSATPTPATSEVPLPVGWEERRTPEGRSYYVDHSNRTTSWVDPRRTQGQYLAPVAGVNSSLGPLPSGWEMRLTPTGRVVSDLFHTIDINYMSPYDTVLRRSFDKGNVRLNLTGVQTGN